MTNGTDPILSPGLRRFWALALLLFAETLAVRPLWGAIPTSDEQYLLELVNRFRMDPANELARLVNINPTSPATWGSPRSDDGDVNSALVYFGVSADLLTTQFSTLVPAQPLAWNSSLNSSATTHNLLMIANDDQQHNFPGEPSLLQRVQNAGYVFSGGGSVAENIYAYTDSVFYGHAGFVIDWGFGSGGIQSPPGHRNALMNNNYREIGISILSETSPLTDVGPLLVTQHLARANSIGPFLTGVAFTDAVLDDDFYTPGEGLGGIAVNIFAANTNTLIKSTTTWESGGYGLTLSPGLYDVVATDPRLHGTVRFDDVSVSSLNVKLDFLPGGLVGDANGDGLVGAADYAIWAAQFGQTASGLSADFDGNGSVGGGDYTLWAANFTTGAGGAQGATGGAGSAAAAFSASVPEPAAGWLLALGSLALLGPAARSFAQRRGRG